MIEEAQNTHWDAIVIGTGIGGATLGYALAKAGKKVLFIEKGKSYFAADSSPVAGDYAEQFFAGKDWGSASNQNILQNAGRATDKLTFNTHKKYQAIPFIGCGTGGSSALYGMVFERFFPIDFATWPINYEEISEYYKQAEKLYRVKGTSDPVRNDKVYTLSPPPPYSPANQELFDFFTNKGLHPYHAPMACDYVNQCKECIGFICAKNCKNDSAKICLKPAIEEYSAKIINECETIRLQANEHKVTGVVCQKGGNEFIIAGDIIALAAGAIQTPAILLRSSSPIHPNGLANNSGMVGKNLMRHLVDLYSIKTKIKVKDGDFTKQLAFNDFYLYDNHKLGTVQAVGNLPPAQVIANDLIQDIDHKSHWLARIVKLGKGFIKIFIRNNLENIIIMAGIMEDLPYPENSVSIDENAAPVINYKIYAEGKKRLAIFRNKIRQSLSPYKITFISNANNNERLAHACGTCRFGDDPKNSVVDKNNKAHDLDNLYIVDASFFPSSAGTNPSLTIAANALRVSNIISSRKI